MRRRSFLAGLVAAATTRWAHGAPAALEDEPGLRLGVPQPFTLDALVERARRMARAPYRPMPEFPEPWLNMTYDEYRSIWFDGRNALWRNGEAPLQVDLFPPGLYFRHAVEISVVENGLTRPVLFDMAVFDRTD